MKGNDWENAILVAHKLHMNRAKKQAERIGINSIIYHNPPKKIDINSRQWWTRTPISWKIHEIYTVPYLKLHGKF